MDDNDYPYVVLIHDHGDGEAFSGMRPFAIRFKTEAAANVAAKWFGRGNTNTFVIYDGN